jgi:hypothetical protein
LQNAMDHLKCNEEKRSARVYRRLGEMESD